jgi:putative transposase
MLSDRRDEEAATAFFKQAINNNGLFDKVVMDKSGANYASLANINLLLILAYVDHSGKSSSVAIIGGL